MFFDEFIGSEFVDNIEIVLNFLILFGLVIMRNYYYLYQNTVIHRSSGRM